MAAALAGADLLRECAPGALVLDLYGVLTGPSRPDPRVRRFGSGRQA